MHIDEQAYTLLLNATDCGPFDGGCVLAAMALQIRFGGELCVIVDCRSAAEHAVVKVGNRYVDFDGFASTEAEMVARFNHHENTTRGIAIRLMQQGDLSDCLRCVDTARLMATHIIEG